MCTNQALEDRQELSLVLGLHKPLPFSLAEGARKTIDEDEGHYEEQGESDGIEASICIVELVVEVVS